MMLRPCAIPHLRPHRSPHPEVSEELKRYTVCPDC